MFHVKQYKIPAIVCSILCIFVLIFSFIPLYSSAVSNEGYYVINLPTMVTSYFPIGASFMTSGYVTADLPSDISSFYFTSIHFNVYEPGSITFHNGSVDSLTFSSAQSGTLRLDFDSMDNLPDLDDWLSLYSTFYSEPPPSTGTIPLLSGYYQFLPTTYTPFDPSYIGVGNTLSFTNMTDMYAVFRYGDKLPIDKLSFSLRVNNAIVYLDTYIESPSWVEPILIARTSMPQGTETGSTSLPSDTSFNPPLGSFLYFEVNNDDFELDTNTFNLLSDLLSYSTSPPSISERPIIPEPPPSEWTENPFVTILSMIIEALQVPLFGYFSPFDIFITLLGIFITIWLLKFIAGG